MFRIKRIILISFFTTVIVGGSLFFLIYEPNQIERSIDEEYKPDEEYELPPKKGKLVNDIELEGTWLSPISLDYTAITFKKELAGKYSVKFCSGGCLMEWELDRQATYEKGIITLNRPVREYLPALYTKMYTIRFNGHVYLIASERIKDFENDNDDSHEMWLLKKDKPKNE